MKHILIILAVAAFIASKPQAHAMFGRTQAERERRIEAERTLGAQIVQQQQSANKWEGIAFILGVGCIVTLVAGAAIGSNGRKNVQAK